MIGLLLKERNDADKLEEDPEQVCGVGCRVGHRIGNSDTSEIVPVRQSGNKVSRYPIINVFLVTGRGCQSTVPLLLKASTVNYLTRDARRKKQERATRQYEYHDLKFRLSASNIVYRNCIGVFGHPTGSDKYHNAPPICSFTAPRQLARGLYRCTTSRQVSRFQLPANLLMHNSRQLTCVQTHRQLNRAQPPANLQ